MNTREREAKLERMLAECVPGGSSCDPQRVADAIREWFAANGTHIAEGSASSEGAERKCGCGLATCIESWEPGCGLGMSKEHAVAVAGDVESRIDTAVAAEHEQRITVADVARLIECKVADVIKAGYEHCSFFGTANQEVSAEGAVLLARWTLHAGNHDWKEGS